MHFRDVPNLGLWRTDFVTGQTAWSREMFLIYGLKPEIHSPSVDVLMKYLHRDDRDLVSHTIHSASKSLTPFSFFHRIVRNDRSVRSLYSMGRFDIESNGKVTCRYGICVDLTGLLTDEIRHVKDKVGGVELPPIQLLVTLDPNDKHIATILGIASMAHKRMMDKIASGNSADPLLT